MGYDNVKNKGDGTSPCNMDVDISRQTPVEGLSTCCPPSSMGSDFDFGKTNRVHGRRWSDEGAERRSLTRAVGKVHVAIYQCLRMCFTS